MRKEPREIIRKLKKSGGKVRETARTLGISPGTVVFWKKRARSIRSRFALSTRQLVRKSTRPKRLRRRTLSGERAEALLRLREEKGYGARKLKVLLGLSEHPATIHRFLKAKGHILEGASYRRPRYQETTHMYLKNVTAPGKLQMDVKYVTPELSGLPHTLYLYAVIDIWSRYKAGVIFPELVQDFSIEALRTVSLPFVPDFVQTDNGLEFQSRFRAFVTGELGWKHHFIHKANPNENAVIERSFRTDEEEFFWRFMKKPASMEDLNAQYQAFLREYNHERPHLGIELKTPYARLQECSIC
ncbi:MAG: integrase core domain-containing protein [bacterium]